MTARSQIQPFNATTAPQYRYEGDNEDQFRRELERWSKVLVSAIATDPLGPSGGGNIPVGVAIGDLLYGSAVDVWSRLAIGSSGSYLKAGATTPSWTAPAALTKTDDTNVTLTLGGSPTTALLNAASLTLGWTGTLGATRGGTGTGTVAVGDLLYGSGVNTWSKLAANATASNKYLRSVSSGAPSWEAIVAGDLTPGSERQTLQTVSGVAAWTTAIVPGADNTSGWTLGTAATARWYGVYVGTEVVVGTPSTLPGFITGTEPLRVFGSITFKNGVLSVVRDSGAGALAASVYAASPLLSVIRYNGSIGSESAVLVNDELGRWQFNGYDGTTLAGSNGTAIAANAGANWSNTDHSARLIFYTTPVGSTTLTSRWVMFENGNWRPSTDNAVSVGTSGTRPSSVFGYTIEAKTIFSVTTDNAVDVGATSTRPRTVYGYTGDFTTQVKSPILASGSATDLILQYNTTEKVRVLTAETRFASGNNLAFFGTGSFGSGTQVVFLANTSAAPSGSPTGGGLLYVESGALKYKGSSGSVTVLAAA